MLLGIVAVITWIGVQVYRQAQDEEIRFWDLLLFLIVFYTLFWLIGGFE